MPGTSTSDVLLGRHAFLPSPSKRRILLYAPLAYSTPHYETDLEIAQRHLDLGDAVTLVLCNGELPSCQLNPQHEVRRCTQCISRSLQGVAQLSIKAPVLELPAFLNAEDHQQLAALPTQFADHDALRTFTFHGFDVGMAALSSIIDFTRSLRVDTRQHANLIHRTVLSAALSFLAMKRILAAGRYDCVYIYNGRWSMMRSAVRACEQAGVPFFTHERGSDCQKFTLYTNTLPHNKENLRRRVQATWELAKDDPTRDAKAAAFFDERRRRVERKWFSHTKQQQAGRLPEDWHRGARRIVYFTSSEFESAAIGDQAKDRIYCGQIAALPKIAGLLAAADPACHLWVRVHPNDKTNNGRWTDAAKDLANITLISSAAEIDSYALLDGADRILTFGSTIGIEATYWGKPAVCAEHSFYNGLGAQYEATTEAELIELLTREGLPPQCRESAMRYGYYLNHHGDDFLHFRTQKISDYEFQSPFRGRCLKPDFADLRQRLIELFNEGSYRRVASLSEICSAFAPDDVAVQSIRILSLLRSSAFDAALGAAECAATKLSSSHLEHLLKAVGKELIDSTQLLSQQASTADFKSALSRVGALMQRAPAFAGVAQKLLALSERVVRAA